FIVAAAPTPVGPGTYEETDANVVFSGSWTSFTDPANSGGGATYSGQTGASVGLTYTGTTVTLVVLKQSNTGIATVTVDGAVVDQLDTYSATRLFRQQKTYTTAAGTHTISVAISGNKNAASGGPFIIFDAFMVAFATPQSLVMVGQPGDSIVGTQPRVFTTGGATFSGSSADGGTTVGINLT